MSHFAKINKDNIVDQVLVVSKEVINSGILGDASKWIQTSYNTRGGVHYSPDTNEPSGQPAFRKNYAGIGFTYDVTRDAFIPPKPFPSWTLNEETCLWEAPIPMPNDDEFLYEWDESSISWVKLS